MEELDSLNQDEDEETSKNSSEESDSQTDKKDELIKNYKIRAEKAEKELKILEAEKEKKEPEKTSELSTKDILYFAKADIHEDDLSDILEWAKFKKISVNEAHKALKGTLDVRNEERRTAEAANTSSSGHGTQITGKSLIEKARQGQLSEKEEDIDKIVETRMQEKINKK